MSTYIPNPAIMGAQMADEMSRQRVNAIAQAQNAYVADLNKAAMLQNQQQMDLLGLQARLAAGMDAQGNPIKRGSDAWQEIKAAYDNYEKQLTANYARATGTDPTKKPGDVGFYVAQRNVSPVLGARYQGPNVIEGYENWTPEQQSSVGVVPLTLEQLQFISKGKPGTGSTTSVVGERVDTPPGLIGPPTPRR